MTLKEIAKKHLATWPLFDAESHHVLTRNISGGEWLGYRTELNPLLQNVTGFDVNVLDGVFFVLSITVDLSERGKGHGNTLYKVLEAIAKNAGCIRVQMTASGWTHTGESRKDYLLRRGYREFENIEVVKDLTNDSGFETGE